MQGLLEEYKHDNERHFVNIDYKSKHRGCCLYGRIGNRHNNIGNSPVNKCILVESCDRGKLAGLEQPSLGLVGFRGFLEHLAASLCKSPRPGRLAFSWAISQLWTVPPLLLRRCGVKVYCGLPVDPLRLQGSAVHAGAPVRDGVAVPLPRLPAGLKLAGVFPVPRLGLR